MTVESCDQVTEPQDSSTGSAPVDEGSEALVIDSLRKHFVLSGGRHVAAVDDISLVVDRGEFVVLLGPSGCGKTTLLRCVAGLESPDAGRLTLGGRTIFDQASRIDRAPEKRGLSMVFQTYALWPHLTAAQNVAYPLKARGRSRAEVKERVAEVLSLVGVSDQAARYPSQMSGGQQQRVALARALAPGSELVLFDEPLSNIDAKVREQLRLELLEMQRALGFTALYVTHDQDEAMQLAHRIVVLREGKIEQAGSPQQIYDDPASLYVSRFVGRANEVAAKVGFVGDGCVEATCEFGAVTARLRSGGAAAGDDIVLIFRPEQARLIADRRGAEADGLSIDGVVSASSYAGTHRDVVVRSGDHVFVAEVPVRAAEGIEPGATTRIVVSSDNLIALPGGVR